MCPFLGSLALVLLTLALLRLAGRRLPRRRERERLREGWRPER